MTASALWAAVRIEDEVVYGYGVVGAHLRGADRRLAAQRLAVHQQLRDRLRHLGAQDVAAAPAYRLPFAVTDATAAIRLAVRLEEGSARAAYAMTVEAAPASSARRLAVDMLAEVSTAASRWRARGDVGIDPAFPGQPAATSGIQPSTTPTMSPSSSTAASGSTS